MRSNKPNAILIVSDTFRHDLLEGFSVRGRKVKTPSLSALASQSAVFKRAYAASFPTVPNRHDLLTGKFTFTYSDWEPLPRGEVTLPTMLKKAGYLSMMIADTPHILQNGFNYDRGFEGWVWTRGQENDRFRTSPREVKLPCDPAKLRDVETTLQHLRNNAGREKEEDWIPVKTAIEAMHWLEENRSNEPFFLYVDFFDPHEPWDPPRWLVDALDPGYTGEEVIYPLYGPSDFMSEDEIEHVRALYAAEALLVDKWIGRLFEKVVELGLLDRTSMIFTSDHGHYLGEHGLIGKSVVMGKYHGYAPLYEEVAHVPLLIRLPDGAGVGHSEVEELAQHPDITATVLELAGLNPGDFGVQGNSLLPQAIGEGEREGEGEGEGERQGGKDKRKIAVTCPPIVHGVSGGLRPTVTSLDDWSLIMAPFPPQDQALGEIAYTMIVDGKQRVLRPFGEVKTELYDLGEDPGQSIDLAKERPDLVERLHGEFLAFLRSLGTPEERVKPFEKLAEKKGGLREHAGVGDDGERYLISSRRGQGKPWLPRHGQLCRFGSPRAAGPVPFARACYSGPMKKAFTTGSDAQRPEKPLPHGGRCRRRYCGRISKRENSCSADEKGGANLIENRKEGGGKHH